MTRLIERRALYSAPLDVGGRQRLARNGSFQRRGERGEGAAPGGARPRFVKALAILITRRKWRQKSNRLGKSAQCEGRSHGLV